MIFLDLPKTMAVCLSLTLIIECIVAFILRVKSRKDYINILAVNILTNPILVCTSAFIKYFYGPSVYNIIIIILEILVVLIEGFIYHKYLEYKKINGFILSLILNLSSYSLGLILGNLFI